MTVRGSIEASFARWGRVVVGRCWLTLAAAVALTLGSATLLPQLRVDNSDEAFLHADDPERLRYDRFKNAFDSENRVVILLQPPAIYDRAFLGWLRTYHRALATEVPYVEDVTSLLNARHTRGEGDTLIVEDLMAVWPGTAADLARLRERVRANPLFTNILVSEDETLTTITLKPFTYSTRGPQADALAGFEGGEPGDGAPAAYLTTEESYEMLEKIREVTDRHARPDVRTYVIGGPSFDYALTEIMQRDVSNFMGLSLGIILLVLLVVFRRISGVLLPVVVVLSSGVTSFGLMVLLDMPFSVTLNMLPAFLIVVGVCDSIHILVIVYQQLAAGRPAGEAIPHALGHSGLAVVMTSLTTATGLLSFAFAEIAPVAQLGVIASIGVMVCMVYCLTMLPALLAILPLEARVGDAASRVRTSLEHFLAGVGDLATGHPGRVLLGTTLLVAIVSWGVLDVRFSHDGLRWFPEGDPLRRGAELADRVLRGTSTCEVVLHTDRVNGLHDPDTLVRIERAMRRSETLTVAGHPISKAISIVDIVKETHQALNENRPAYYVIPRDRELVAQELLLFENSGSDDLEDVTDSQFEIGRMTVRTPWVDAMVYPAFVDELAASLREILGPDIRFELTGGAVIFTRIFKALILSMARSYGFAIVVITLLMLVLIGDLRRGLVAMIPNLIPIYFVLGIMGWMDIPLDLGTLLIGGIVIGLAVDDTIHFMHKFNRYYEETGDPHAAVHRTLETTGAAMLFTSLVLALGFSVFTAGYLRNTVWFGLLTSSATVVAFLADVVVAPALMVLVTPTVARAASGPASRS